MDYVPKCLGVDILAVFLIVPVIILDEQFDLDWSLLSLKVGPTFQYAILYLIRNQANNCRKPIFCDNNIVHNLFIQNAALCLPLIAFSLSLSLHSNL